jgi:secernin
MCDTFVVLPEATSDGSVIFGKNSDREPNEAAEVVLIGEQTYPKGSVLRCTYMEIPQIEHTNQVLLLKPFWMWGAEMGANQHGVVIGNEAVFTRMLGGKVIGLTGMDLIRLALERSASAREAVETITSLLERYGQGGNCGFTHPFYYHNSFIVADTREAWVVETAGKEWTVQRASGVRSISNALTIGDTWDAASAGLVSQAVSRGWCKDEAEFHFARCYTEPFVTYFGAGRQRQVCTTTLLNRKKGAITLQDAFSVLRSHGMDESVPWRPDAAITGADVCMHVGFGPVRISQSVSSFTAHLTPTKQTFWVTGTSAPCTGIFKPLWMDGAVPWSDEPAPTGRYNPACLWWRHEQIHRQMIHQYSGASQLIRDDQRRLEQEFIEAVQRVGGDRLGREAVAAECYKKAEAIEKNWLESLQKKTTGSTRFYFQTAWRKFNREAGLELLGV